MSNINPFISTNKINPYHTGELSGLNFGIKDNIDVINEITGYGSPSWAETHPIPVANAICLDQLLSAGATSLGKTHTDELAYSLIGINSFYGTPLNPKAPDRVPGGSSSGSASAVASGLVDFAIGTDTGGSVRVPASNCGIWGYRPSHGLISVAGVAALAPSFDTVGIFSNTAEILEQVMSVLLAENTNQYNESVSLCFLDEILQLCDKQILKSIMPVMSEIANYHSVEHLTLSMITEKHVNCEWLFEQSGLLLSAEIWNTFGSWVESSDRKLSIGVEQGLKNRAKSANRKDIQNGIHNMKSFSRKLNWYLNKGNILCFPTTLDLAPKIDQITDDLLSKYYPRAMGVNAISGFSRTPQITIPFTNHDGVPVGISFIAGYGQDMILMKFCKELHAKINNKVIAC